MVFVFVFCFDFISLHSFPFSDPVTFAPLSSPPSLALQQVVLRNGTEAFEAWENPPAPIYMQFYFFNLTNPAEVLEGERPAVLEMGPYTYR